MNQASCLKMRRAKSGPGESHTLDVPLHPRSDDRCSIVCIKGHRAPKCNHFERYMTKVRNPGRPLTTCPHIQNHTVCDCKPREAVIMMKLFKGVHNIKHHIGNNSLISSRVSVFMYTCAQHLIEGHYGWQGFTARKQNKYDYSRTPS